MNGSRFLLFRRLQGNTRLLLMAGFGGLLLLMALAGVNALHVLREIQNRNDVIRRDFLGRNRLLNQIRSDLYLSGTYVRDYILEPEAANAEAHRASFSETRREISAALEAYDKLLSPNERRPFNVLRGELADYWRTIDPVMRWDAAQRRERGHAFLSEQLLPRRAAMLSIADQIAVVNERQLTAGDDHVAALFAQFRIRLGMTLAVTLGLGLILAALSMNRILTLEQESRDRFLQIAQAREELKELSARLVDAQENERRAISRELHDEVGQSLSALLVSLGNLSAAIPGEIVPLLESHVSAIRKLAETTVASVRNMALLLRPSMLDDLGLIPALQWQAREVAKRTGLRVNVAAEGVSDDLPEEHRTCIYRVVQEALHNCSRHAEAKTVRITVHQECDGLRLSVQDDGKGFYPKLERGLGLIGMEERVAHLGGSLRIESEPGRGSLLAVRLPQALAAPGSYESVK